MLNKLICFIIVVVFGEMKANAQSYYYQISLKDKGTSLNLSPSSFLSERSVERRKRHQVSITKDDYPVSADYIERINSEGVLILYPLKWSNSVIVQVEDNALLDKIKDFDFVIDTRLISVQGISKKRSFNKFEMSSSFLPDYGPSWAQNGMIGVNQLHKDGYTGSDQLIAVFDAGFRGVDTNFRFAHLWRQGQIVGFKDLVNNKDSVFDHSNHGTVVLSTMGSNANGELIGTAPSSSYYLVISEDVTQEAIIEEYHWARAAEIADSIGADIINSSLGYTTFDDSTSNHSYEDMDGNTTVVTRAANRAYEKGIMVVNSAGNSGNNPWYYIGAPADGYGVLSIGAVGRNQEVASFSSRGPNYSGQVKPDVCAVGWGAFVFTPDGSLSTSNGTSFSGPIIAGASACLKQAYPEMPNQTIMEAIRESAHKYNSPDEHYGYGIPNFEKAKSILQERRFPTVNDSKLYEEFLLFPNPAVQSSRIEFIAGDNGLAVNVRMINMTGQQTYLRSYTSVIGHNYILLDCSNQRAGNYIVELEVNGVSKSQKLVILSRLND